MAEAKSKATSNDSDRALPLIQKLAKIRKMTEVVSKDQSGYGYKYSDINEILANVKAGMEKYGVSLIPQISHATTSVELQTYTNRKTDKTGKLIETVINEMLVSAEMFFFWVNDDNTEDTIKVPWYLVGSQSDPSQAFGSALTYCTRYFMLNYFQIARDNDVDEYRSKQKEALQREDREVTEQLIETIDTEIKAFLGEHKDSAAEVKKLCEKYSKGGNYKAIKESAVAASLLEEFRAKFISGKTEESKGE